MPPTEGLTEKGIQSLASATPLVCLRRADGPGHVHVRATVVEAFHLLRAHGAAECECEFEGARDTFAAEDGTFVHTLGWVYDFKLKDGVVVDKARLVGHGNKSVLGTHFFDKVF